MRRFELVEGTSAKFWQVEVQGAAMMVAWGRLGTAGQSQTKTFADAAKAQVEADKLIREKTGKGYRELAVGASAPPPATVSAPPAVVSAPPAVVSAPPVAAAVPPATPALAPPAGALATAQPTVAAAALPMAAPATPATAPAHEDDGDIAWSPQTRAKVLPFPGFSGADRLPRPDAGKLWTELLAAPRNTDDESLPQLLAELDFARFTELRANPSPPAPATPAEDSAFFGIWASGPDSPDLPGQVVDFLAANGGVLHALETLVVAQQRKQPNPRIIFSGGAPEEGLVKNLSAFLRLRRILAEAAADDYAAARDWAAEARAGQSELLHRCSLACLFPGESWAEDEARQLVLSSPTARRANWVAPLLLSLRSPDLAEQIARRGTAWWSWQEWTENELSLTLLALLGRDALPTLRMLLNKLDGQPQVAEVLQAIGRIRSREALIFLLEREDRYTAGLLPEVVQRSPRLALGACAEVAARKGKSALPAQTLLRSLLAAAGPPSAGELAALPEEAAAFLGRMVAGARATAELAPREAWPEVLRSPPWTRRKKTAGAADAERALEPLPYEETLIFREGEKETWLERETTDESLASLLNNTGVNERVLAALAAGDTQVHARIARNFFEAPLLDRLPPNLALALWNFMPLDRWMTWDGGFERFLLAVDPADSLPRLLQLVHKYPHHNALLLPFDSPRAAPQIAHALTRQRTSRAVAQEWLRRHPQAAAIGLVPAALGKKSEARDAAREALRYLATQDAGRTAIAEIAGRYGVADDIAAVLAQDPLDLHPARPPKLPPFWDAAALPPLRLLNGLDLPAEAMDVFATMLLFTRHDRPYAGIAEVQAACRAESVEAFAWALCERWLAFGAPAKEQWAFLALGLIGGDAGARRLAPLIRVWPGEMAHPRALVGLGILATIGSDVALVLLQSIAEKVKYKSLQEAARVRIAEIAEIRGLSPEELADRLVPTLGLSPEGRLELDFGPRRFVVGFDELLRPSVFDEGGKKLTDLPKPLKSDDAALAEAASARFKALKKDVKSIAGLQLGRLETAMVAERRFPREIFASCLANHPLMRHPARRLVWAAPGAAATLYFRVAEDGSFADADDQLLELPEDYLWVVVPHPLRLPPATAAAFAGIFADYQILQPFAQLGRECFALEPHERGADKLTRFQGRKVATGKLLGLEKYGWRRGEAQDSGIVSWYEKRLRAGRSAYLGFQDGFFVGAPADHPEQTLCELVLGRSDDWPDKNIALSFLTDLEASELLREVYQLL